MSDLFVTREKNYNLKKFQALESLHILRKRCPYSELFWSVFSSIRTEYGKMLHISSYSVRMRENTDQKNSEDWYFSRSGKKQ